MDDAKEKAEIDALREIELLAAVRLWQDKHDMRPSDVVRVLLDIIEVVKPKPNLMRQLPQ